MNEDRVFPQIVNVTDLRYRWSKVEEELERSTTPIIVVDHSTPKAVIIPFRQAQKIFAKYRKGVAKKDPLVEWRRKYAADFADWDATAVIREQRNSRWNLS